MRRTTAPTPPSARRSPRWPLSRGLSVPGPWAFRPRSVGFPSPVRGLFVPGLWAFRPRSVFSLLTGGRFSAFCAFWRPRSLTKLRTGDTSPSDPGRFTFGPATLPFRPALNPVLRRIVVKSRLWPGLNPVLRCIVVKSRSDRCTYGVCAPCGRRRRGRDGRKKSGRRLVTLGRWWAVLDSNQ